MRSSHKHTYEPSKTLPVFGDHDKVEGAVLLDPQLSVTPGRLLVTVRSRKRLAPLVISH